MGTVWQASDELLGRQVAVKQLHLDDEPESTRARLRRERTLREARTVALIQDPHVIVVHDVVEQDGRPWIVMEWIDGESLAERLERGGPLAPREAARIGLCLLAALRAAHLHGVLHRDLKPANVLLEADTGRVVLSDFGVAQVSGATTLTEEGGFVGSPEYTAPERMAGVGTGPEADLWSFGALLCAALSGETPFRRDSLGGVLQAVMHDPLEVPESARPLEGVVRGLLERDPCLRLGVAETEEALRRYLSSGRAPEALARGRARRERRRSQLRREVRRERRRRPLPRTLADRGLAAAARPHTGRGRHALLAAAAVLALAATGTAVGTLMWHLAQTTGDGRGGPGTGTASRPPGASDAPPPSGSTAAPPAPTVTIPAGYLVVQDPRGFTLAVPRGYHREAAGGRIRYSSPGAGFCLGVVLRPLATTGPLAFLRGEDTSAPHRFRGYRGAEVTGTTHNGFPAASWEFTYDGDDGPRHVFAVVWDEAGRRYEVWASGPAGDRDTTGRHFDTALDTFRRLADSS